MHLVDLVVRQIIAWGTLLLLVSSLVSLAGAALTYFFSRQTASRSVGGFLRFAFPAAVIQHPSCVVDWGYAAMFWMVAILQLIPQLLSSIGVTIGTQALLVKSFGPQATMKPSLLLNGLILACAVLLLDFIVFYAHYIRHKIKILWEFHAVHHSSSFLIPITNYRFHPVEVVMDHVSQAIGIGVFIGTASYFSGISIADNVKSVGRAYFVINTLSFYHLRHSHIYMRYGWFEKYFISPAQHQLHHSSLEEHWDKNFGLLLSCWDRLFGTLIYSRPDDNFVLGLPGASNQEYDAVWKLFVTPVLKAVRQFPGRSPSENPVLLLPDPAAAQAGPVRLPDGGHAGD